PDDLDGLITALYRADERLALVDRLLDSMQTPEGLPTQGGLAQSLADLRRARAVAAAEVEAVLEGLAQLRVQIGLRSLVGNSVPVRECLRDLRARLAAVDELADLELRREPGVAPRRAAGGGASRRGAFGVVVGNSVPVPERPHDLQARLAPGSQTSSCGSAHAGRRHSRDR